MHERRSFFLFSLLLFISKISSTENIPFVIPYERKVSVLIHIPQIFAVNIFSQLRTFFSCESEWKVGLINMLSEEILNISKIILAVFGERRLGMSGWGVRVRSKTHHFPIQETTGEEKIWKTGRNPNALLWNDVNWDPFRWIFREDRTWAWKWSLRKDSDYMIEKLIWREFLGLTANDVRGYGLTKYSDQWIQKLR